LASQTTSLESSSASHDQIPSNETSQEVRRLQGMDPVRALTFDDAIVLKDGNLLFITDADVIVPINNEPNFGLSYPHFRVLNGYETRLPGRPPLVLGSSAPTGLMAKLEFTNPTINGIDGKAIPKQKLAIRSLRMIEGDPPALYERLIVQNFANNPVEFLLSLNFRSRFEDVLAIRGTAQDPGQMYAPVWNHDYVQLLYEGRAGWHRSLTIHLDPPPDFTDATVASFRITLAPRALKTLHVSVTPNI